MATITKRLRVLDQLYNKIPKVVCKGLCQDQCSIIPLSQLEHDRLEIAAKRPLPLTTLHGFDIGASLMMDHINGSCPLLVAGRCSVYSIRPSICRAFAAVDGLPCEHGCHAEQPMSAADYRKIRNEITKL